MDQCYFCKLRFKKVKEQEDSLQLLNIFTTMSNPFFLLCYKYKDETTKDKFNPILECFYMYAEMQRLKVQDTAYKVLLLRFKTNYIIDKKLYTYMLQQDNHLLTAS
jgi:hypothetical protein